MEPINKGDVPMTECSVVLAEKDAVCRNAGLDALLAFGFQSGRVYGVWDVDSAAEKVKELHAQASSGPKAPVIALMPVRDCTVFSRHKFRSHCFLVGTSDSATEATQAIAAGQGPYNCKLPQRLDGTVLLACSEVFQDWWRSECAKEQRMNKFHEAAARKRQAKTGAGPQGMALRPPAEAGAGPQGMALRPPAAARASPAALTEEVEDLARQLLPKVAEEPEARKTQALGGYVDLGNVYHTGTTPDLQGASRQTAGSAVSGNSSLSDRRNDTTSLCFLLPERSPFEDLHIIESVGRGSFATVYKAQWDASIVALKVVEHKDKTDETKALFEGTLSATLAHPNLVHTFKHSVRERAVADGSAKGCEVWIVQEWCGLGTLSANAVSGTLVKPGAWLCIAEICCEIASAGAYLHSRGIVHGDLSGTNVLFGIGPAAKGFVAKVCDFGMARVLGDSNSLETQSMGTVSAMPPELFVLEGAALTPKVDVYAFGMLLWMLCSGQVPYHGLEAPVIIVKVSRGKTLDLAPSVPGPLAEVYKKCITRAATERPKFEVLVKDMLHIMNGDVSLGAS